jgi:SH3-like domain-containing protein
MKCRTAGLWVGLAVWIGLLAGPALAGEVFRYKITPPPQATATADTEDSAENDEPETGLPEKLQPIEYPSPPLIVTEPAPAPSKPDSAQSKEGPAAVPQEGQKTVPPAGSEAAAPLARPYVRVEMGHIRQAPDREAPPLFLVKKGQHVVVKEINGGWYLIETGAGEVGWGYKSLFSKSKPDMSEVATKSSVIKAIQTAAAGAISPGTVIVDLNRRYAPRTTIIEDDHPRVVCDFYGYLPAAELPALLRVNDGVVVRVRVGLHDGDAPKTRLVVDLVPGQRYRVDERLSQTDLTYVLRVHPNEGASDGVSTEPPPLTEDEAHAGLGSGAGPVSAHAVEPKRLYVAVFMGNVRQSPRQDADVAFVVKQGQKVLLKATQGRWHQIETDVGQQGWGHQSLFYATPPAVASPQ